jgi:hypothetical protein
MDLVMSYRREKSSTREAALRDQVLREWQQHRRQHPDHAPYGTTEPLGWRCCGGLDGRRCPATSSTVKTP